MVRLTWRNSSLEVDDSCIALVNFNSVDGSTINFLAHWPRMKPSDFRTKTLDANLTDSDGIPAPKVFYKLSDNTCSMLEHGTERTIEVLHAAGAKRILAKNTEDVWWRAGLYQIGTCRMGSDPRTPVVNGWGRCHEVKNLFVVDGSAFVNADALNPTSTIQALALYIVKRIKTNIGNLFD